MKIASFGDVHLGPSASRDRFCHLEEDLLEFTAHVRATHDRAVLVGDVFQSDWGWRIGPCPHEVDTILRRYARVWQAWSDSYFTMIAGNHDHVTRGHLGAQEVVTFSADGINVFYLHGDRYDLAIRGPAPDLTMWTVGRLRGLGLRRAADVIENVLLEHGAVWLNDGDPVQRVADRIGGDTSSHVVVAGHTHLPVCAALDDVVYANSGAFSPDNQLYVSVDTQRRTVELRSFHRGGDVKVVAQVPILTLSAESQEPYSNPTLRAPLRNRRSVSGPKRNARRKSSTL